MFLLKWSLFRWHSVISGRINVARLLRFAQSFELSSVNNSRQPQRCSTAWRRRIQTKSRQKRINYKPSRWLNQPIWKIWVKLGSSSPNFRGENSKTIWVATHWQTVWKDCELPKYRITQTRITERFFFAELSEFWKAVYIYICIYIYISVKNNLANIV